ncbi:MFS general substrate transporter protein [Rutstroemia sp. NJR-2017a WRK4]|nr:MFS general substrate transporter protein [Rutstroemia sp. NJR-2017a WRK4]
MLLLASSIRLSSPLLKTPPLTRAVSTLSSNPHIYIHTTSPSTHILHLLPSTPPIESLSLGHSTSLPPTPSTFTPNPHFPAILSRVLSQHAHTDPQLLSQAAAFATTSQAFTLSPSPRRRLAPKTSTGAGGASSQGGAGSGGRGGYIHLSDSRAPPDYGRIAYPEDIFGSLEVDASGNFVAGSEGKQAGNWQDSGTYRIVTREGVFGLTDFLRGKLVEELKKEEERIKKEGGK